MSKAKKNTLSILSIAAAACLIYGISSGIRGNYGVMLNAIMQNSGLDYASVSFVLSFGQLMVGIVQPIMGMLALKKNNSFVLSTGTILMILGLLTIPFCHSMVTLMVAFILLSAGAGAISFGIVMGAITPVIGAQAAAVVSGFISASSGCGGIVISPLMQQLTARIGLRGMLMVFCIPIIVLFVITLWLGRTEKQADTEAGEEQLSVIKVFKESITDRSYLFIFLAFFTCGYHMSIIETHLYSQYVSYGFAETMVAFALSVYGIGAMVGCIITGFLSARFPNRIVLGCTYWSRILVTLALILLPKSIPLLYVTAFLYGCSGNATVPPTSGLITKLYGARKLGILFGTAYLAHQVGAFISGSLGGILLNATGGYTMVWITSMVLTFGAGSVAMLVKEPK